jgi:hypothetical protein
MEVLCRSIRKNDSKIILRICPLSFCGLHFRALLDPWSILRVNPFEELLPSGPYFLRLIVINAKNLLRHLFRPEDCLLRCCTTARAPCTKSFRKKGVTTRYRQLLLAVGGVFMRNCFQPGGELSTLAEGRPIPYGRDGSRISTENAVTVNCC